MAGRPLSLLARLRARHHPFVWVTLGLFCVSLGLFAFTLSLVLRHGWMERDFGWSFLAGSEGTLVAAVRPGSPADGRLRAGDRVVAFDGDPRVAPAALEILRDRIVDGASYRVRVARAGEELEYDLPLPLVANPRIAGEIVNPLISFAGLVALCVAVGLLKPDTRYGKFSVVSTTIVAWVMLKFLVVDRYGPYLHGAGLGVAFLCMLVMTPVGPLALHFFTIFPPGLPRSRFWSSVLKVAYGWSSLHVLQTIAFGVAYLVSAHATMEILLSNPRLVDYHLFYLQGFGNFASCALIVPLLIRNYRLAGDADQRRRIRWIVLGTIVSAFTPIIDMAADGVAYLATGRILDRSSVGLWTSISYALFLVSPMTMGYAILKHRVMDINVVVRRGVRYLLTKNALRALLALPALALAYSIYTHPQLTVGEIVSRESTSLYLIIALVLGLAFQKRLSEWVDRRFFREAYDRERLLLALIDHVRQLDSMEEISRRVSEELEATLHPTRLYLFYRSDREGLALGYSSGGADEPAALPLDAGLVRELDGERHARQVPDDLGALGDEERELLERMGVVLAVPMSDSEGRLEGLLLLGEKRSDEPYAPGDRRLLEAIAAEIGMAREHVALKHEVARERRERVEVLARMGEGGADLLRECRLCGRCYDGSAQRCAEDGSELELSLPVERVVDGKYRLDRLLGRGGMGAVYEGDERLGRRVAVKIMTGSGLGDRTATRRFEREARALAKLRHPNIVGVYDYGRIGSESAYLVMELLEGRTLRAELQRSGRLAPAAAAEVMAQLVAAVGAAHAAGVIHRDLKPENVVLLAGEGGAWEVRVLDFGLAKLEGAASRDATTESALTRAGAVMGTLGYMAPEQLQGQSVDERVDVYALGVMAVEMLTGARPYDGQTWMEVMAAMQRDRWHLEDGGEAALRLEAALRRCLALDPNARVRSVGDLAAELVPAMYAYGQGSGVDQPTKAR